ncbi:type II secretion system F family protein [Candidatus Woesearchaeota archaeon]|nr:type II secretion system F family protein [Candidatus Woesearchaeota archaeon]
MKIKRKPVEDKKKEPPSEQEKTEKEKKEINEDKEDREKLKTRKRPPFRTRLQLMIPGLEEYLNRAGMNINARKLSKIIFSISLFLNFTLLIFILYYFFDIENIKLDYLVLIIPFWIVNLFVLISVFWFLFCLFIDLKIKAKTGINLKKPQKKEEQEISLPLKKKKEQQKISSFRRKKRLIGYVNKAGIEVRFSRISIKIFRFAVIFTLIFNAYLLYTFSNLQPSLLYVILTTLLLWTLGFLLLVLIIWSFFFFVVDLTIYKRTKTIEEVLPDFLHLASANISAGMPIDRALWFAVRPRFGVLAKEIEEVAKSTLVGEKLDKALLRFTDKYDSVILKRSINLLLEGVESGGEIADLLNRIARDIEETRIIRKEMAANVTTYVIFILFATVIAAPFLFGLSTELIVIMQSILSNIEIGSLSESTSGMGSMFNITGESVAVSDYKIFVISCICITSFFSTVIINIIKKGNIKEGIHLIPVFILISLLIYFISVNFMHLLLGGFFS